jgi:hypothetical protein
MNWATSGKRISYVITPNQGMLTNISWVGSLTAWERNERKNEWVKPSTGSLDLNAYPRNLNNETMSVSH